MTPAQRRDSNRTLPAVVALIGVMILGGLLYDIHKPLVPKQVEIPALPAHPLPSVEPPPGQIPAEIPPVPVVKVPRRSRPHQTPIFEGGSQERYGWR